jgi:hypothetical protein
MDNTHQLYVGRKSCAVLWSVGYIHLACLCCARLSASALLLFAIECMKCTTSRSELLPCGTLKWHRRSDNLGDNGETPVRSRGNLILVADLGVGVACLGMSMQRASARFAM